MHKFIEKIDQLGGLQKYKQDKKKFLKLRRNLQTLTPRIFKGTESKKRTWDCICSERERERERDFGFITLLFSVSVFLKWLLLRGQGKDM